MGGLCPCVLLLFVVPFVWKICLGVTECVSPLAFLNTGMQMQYCEQFGRILRCYWSIIILTVRWRDYRQGREGIQGYLRVARMFCVFTIK